MKKHGDIEWEYAPIWILFAAGTVALLWWGFKAMLS
jgi:hypothetical protein